jgi:hypothetical protein
MLNDNIECDHLNGKTYRTFNGWKSWGFRIKKGEKSSYNHPIFGSMFSSEQVWNPVNSSFSMGKELNYLSKYGHV